MSQEIIDRGWEGYKKHLEDDFSFVDVGIVASDGAKKLPEDDLTLAEIASINEFGAVINHPGGTAFGFKSEASAERGEVRFLKKGEGFVSGVTGPHEIIIPSRPFMRGTFDENEAELGRLVDEQEKEILAGRKTRKQALKMIGQTHRNQIQEAINTTGKFAPNAPSTIRKKGSAQPLKDKSRLTQSIDFEVG